MFTVFLADDEFTILEGLKHLFNWEKAGFNLIGEASDGDDAFQYIKELKPDLVITDIRMSGLSGLELIRAVKDNGLSCKFLIVSGYDDFSYCLEALRLGVSDYILKPIDFSSIEAKVGKIAAELLDNNSIKASSVEISRVVEDSHRMKLDRYFAAAFGNTPEYKESVFYINSEETPEEYYYCVCLAGRYDSGCFLSASKIDSHEPEFFHAMTIEGKMAYIMGFLNKSGAQSKIKEFELRVRLIMEMEVSSQVAVGIGSLYKLEDIKKSYKQALNAVESEVFYRTRIDENSKFTILDSKFDNQVKSKIDQVVCAVRHVDSEKAEEAADKFISFIYENRFVKAHVEAMLQELSVLINNAIYELKQETEKQEAELQGELQDNHQVISFNLYELKSLEDCKQILKEAVSKAISEISRMYDSRMNPFIKVKAYINSHYREDLNLSRLAKEFHMNSSYLSRLFKEKCHINYSDYLTMVRIEKSKKLLLSTDLSINEVSESVGFSDYRYFTKVFKRYQGVAPNMYKKSSSKVYTTNQAGL